MTCYIKNYNIAIMINRLSKIANNNDKNSQKIFCG